MHIRIGIRNATIKRPCGVLDAIMAYKWLSHGINSLETNDRGIVTFHHISEFCGSQK
nr:MAG TPA: hypothetical protein [Caudoviricetes sp.]